MRKALAGGFFRPKITFLPQAGKVTELEVTSMKDIQENDENRDEKKTDRVNIVTAEERFADGLLMSFFDSQNETNVD
jgi:hypothetical protein